MPSRGLGVSAGSWRRNDFEAMTVASSKRSLFCSRDLDSARDRATFCELWSFRDLLEFTGRKVHTTWGSLTDPHLES